MKQRISNASYNKEFREQAVKRVHDEGLNPEAVAHISMPKSTLAT
jgi:transposase-like protein